MKQHLLSGLIITLLLLGSAKSLYAETTTLSVPVQHQQASDIALAIERLASDNVTVSVFENKIYLRGSAAEILALKATIREMDSPLMLYEVVVSQTPPAKSRYSTHSNSQTTGRFLVRAKQWLVVASIEQQQGVMSISPFHIAVDNEPQLQQAVAVKITPQSNNQVLMEYQVVSRKNKSSEQRDLLNGSSLIQLEQWTALLDSQERRKHTTGGNNLYVWIKTQ